MALHARKTLKLCSTIDFWCTQAAITHTTPPDGRDSSIVFSVGLYLRLAPQLLHTASHRISFEYEGVPRCSLHFWPFFRVRVCYRWLTRRAMDLPPVVACFSMSQATFVVDAGPTAASGVSRWFSSQPPKFPLRSPESPAQIFPFEIWVDTWFR